jgi:tRNA dimethylallyltransferase
VHGAPAQVVAVFGPTASGKTDVAEALADRLDGEVVSADAMQVYRGLPVLTNQPARPTRLVGIWPLAHEASVVDYARLAHEVIDDLLTAGRVPIVAGGTGLYLRAALADLDVPPAPPAGSRERWAAHYEQDGPAAAHASLAARDPAAAAAIHPNDRRRVVRALELTDVGASLRPPEDRLWGVETRHPTVVVGLDVPKEVLDRRIAERNRRMIERGVEQEVRAALTAGDVSSTARHVHGLRELAELPREQALAEMDAQMRRYAAYQRKWMRRIPGLELVDADRPAADVAAEIVTRLGRRAAGAAAPPG